VEKRLRAFDEGENFQIALLVLLRSAWENVTSEVIENFFSKVFTVEYNIHAENENITTNSLENNLWDRL
jgi:hypothetical protein